MRIAAGSRRSAVDAALRRRDNRGMIDLDLVTSDQLLDELHRRYPSMLFVGASAAFAACDPASVRFITRRAGYAVVQAGMVRVLETAVAEDIADECRRGGV